ncbi:M48 family metalloprotease [Acinetobacter larvae]|uniref:Peptidase M48 n=1 Tax=Acinetobacter larvae TaxID=1789224 RepID=A0A1B2M0K4_9GAMM|nr:M48 family metalloprotease [Acinetobacter larvae]AOA58722.1 peptidase M48 [Acinetobacter larvae]
MRDMGQYLIKNKNMLWSVSIYMLAVLLCLFILNSVAGLLVYYFDHLQSVWWHALSLYLLVAILTVIIGSIFYEFYVFRAGGHTLAKQLRARRLILIESTPEESVALKLVDTLAKHFAIDAPAVYVLPDESGVNALTAGFQPKDTVVILTWGALQNLDELELYGLLAHEFHQILSGEVTENTNLKILYSGLTTFSQWGSKIAKQGFSPYGRERNKFETLFVAVGGLIWLFGCLGVLVARLIKYCTLRRRTYYNDTATAKMVEHQANIQTLLRIYAHHAGSQIHSEYSEAIAHMCFANSLSPQSWLNIHPSIEARLYAMNPSLLQDVQLEDLKKIRSQPWYKLIQSFEDASPESYTPWIPPQPLPLLRLSPISFSLNDAIKPLNPVVRRQIERPELLQRALQTSTGSREVMVAILMIRQYREFIPSEAAISRAIVDALLHLDGRVHIQIFFDACDNLGAIPNSIARQFLTKLAKIIQEDGEIGLLDALLLEKVKAKLNLLPAHTPTSLENAKAQIVRLIDALLHVQQINSSQQLSVRYKILERVLSPEELELYEEISDEPIDLSEILNDVAGLLLRDRLNILGIAEICLWHERIISQDELDVLALLYWRLGFEHEEIVDQMLKKNSVMIF